MTAASRNGLPEPRPYVYRGTGTEMSPAETAAHLRKKDREVPENQARVRASLPGTRNQDDDLDGVVTRRETDPVRSFTLHLGARMRALGWNTAELAERAGVSGHVAGRAVNGNGCELAVAGKLAALVGRDLAAMVSGYVCGTCQGSPPAGFSCLECGTEGERR